MLILISKVIQVISTTIVTIIDPPNIVETKTNNTKQTGKQSATARQMSLTSSVAAGIVLGVPLVKPPERH